MRTTTRCWTCAASLLIPLCVAAEPAGEAPASGDDPPGAPRGADAPSSELEETIVVTGSRVKRKDLTTPAPVTVTSREALTAEGARTLGELLQLLPEQGNALSRQMNNGGDGSTRVSLRSLGDQRTLVLLNGRRYVAGGVGADRAVDLNTLPAAAVERVEILKDGASPIYGSDAMGGVVNVITRKRWSGVEAAAQGGVTSRGDAAAYGASLTARSAGAQVLFVPALARTGSGYDLTVRAVDLARGETLFTTREPAVSSRLFAPAIDRLVSRIRRSLKEEPEDARRPAIPVEDVAPANPEALPHYAEGKRLESEARFHEAFEAYREAAAADASFLLPLVEILRYTVQHLGGAQYREIADVEAQRKALRDGLHRLPEKERAYAETLVLPWGEERNMTEAIAALDRSIEGWPEDPRPYVDAANILLLQRADLEAAGPYVEKALALAPLDEGGVIDFLLAAGRLDEALVRATRWVEASPSWLSLNNLHLVHQHRGEVEEDLEVSRRMMQLDPDGFRFPFYAFIAAGAVDEAEAIRRRLRRTDPSWLAIRGRVRDALAAWDVWYRPAPGQPGADIDHTFFRSFIVLPREDPQATWREAEKLFRVGYGFFQCHALQLALLGDRERAFRLAISKAPDGHVCHRLHMAVRAWKGGDREGALSAFSRIWAHSSHLYRGEILAEMGRHREAVDEFRTYRRRRGVSIWDNNFDKRNYPRSLYLEAVSLDALGARAEARNVLALLLKLWERADADLPLLRDAKALERRLFARGR